MNTCPRYPCRSCVYFKVCWNSNRREFCAGRKTKRQQKREKQKEAGK